MEQDYWDLIAKHLAGETNSEEEESLRKLMESDAEIKRDFEASKEIWSKIDYKSQDFNKERIIKLREQKIKAYSLKIRMKSYMKYAAIFFVFVLGTLFVYNDLNRTTTIVAEDATPFEFILPDGSSVLMHKGAELTFSSSYIKSFDRHVKLNGEAFFQIKKMHGEHFIVATNYYDIEVLGTKFNVNTNSDASVVVLTEGSIALSGFSDTSIENKKLVPGQLARYDSKTRQLNIKKVNPEIYMAWSSQQLNFDKFTIADLAEIFRIHYGKTLINSSGIELNNSIGGSAPTDDMDLIVKGLSIVLKREIIQINDTIIIK